MANAEMDEQGIFMDVDVEFNTSVIKGLLGQMIPDYDQDRPDDMKTRMRIVVGETGGIAYKVFSDEQQGKVSYPQFRPERAYSKDILVEHITQLLSLNRHIEGIENIAQRYGFGLVDCGSDKQIKEYSAKESYLNNIAAGTTSIESSEKLEDFVKMAYHLQGYIKDFEPKIIK